MTEARSSGAASPWSFLDPGSWTSYARMKLAGGAAAAIQHRSDYRPDVDGLRAVAVLAVVLYHAGLPLASGGFVGVDVFFVISGYVIAKSLLGDLEAGRFSISAFYERRVRRIFPALAATFLGAFAAALFLLPPSYFVDFSRSLAASAGFVSNIYFWKSSGYFANGADLRPLLHTWSLSVEEQYYIFAPVGFFLIYRFFRRRWLWVLLPTAILSLALSIHATRIGPTANFFLLPTRAWEVLLGAMLALRPPPGLQARWLREVIALIGFAMIAYAVLAYSEATPFPGVTALAPCVGAALLIYSGGQGNTAASRVLASPPMVGVGLISYSLYLVHWPVISFLTFYRLRDPGPADVAPITAVSLLLAVLSWRYVERPFRSQKTFPASRRAILIGAGAVIAALIGLGLLGAKAGGFPGRFDQAAHAQRDPKGLWGEGTCFLDNNPDVSRWNDEACTLTRGGDEAVLLWGDSYAAHYVPGIQAAAARIPYRVIQYTAAGCPPILSYAAYSRPNCAVFNRNALSIIRRHGIRTVIISARWVDLQRRGLGELSSTLDALNQMGVRAYVIGQSPMFTTDVELIAMRRGGLADDAWTVSFDPGLNTRLKALAGRDFVDPLAAICRGGSCTYRKNGELLFGDDGHFSRAGSVRAVLAYFPLVQSGPVREGEAPPVQPRPGRGNGPLAKAGPAGPA